MEIPGPPSDPSDIYYLKVCYVCGEIAKPGQTHMRNYGGIVCLGCRQFFRRMHQNGKVSTLVCKKNDNCIINTSSWRKCQKCRYRLCITAGMTPSAVLSEEQKRIRFQRMMQRRNAELLSMSQEDFSRLRMNPEARGQTYFPSLAQASAGVASTSETQTTLARPDQSIKDPVSCGNSNPVEQPSRPGKRPRGKNPNEADQPPIKIRFKKSPESKDFLVAVGQSNTTILQDQELLDLVEKKRSFISQIFCKAMVSFGLDQNHGLCFKQVTRYAMAFHKFANSLGTFRQIRDKDKQFLLGLNTPLFVQACIVTHLSCDESLPFLNLLFGGELELAKYSNLIGNSDKSLIKNINLRSLLAYVLLFHNDSNMKFENPDLLLDGNIMLKLLLDQFSAGLLKIPKVLSKLAKFASSKMGILAFDLSCKIPCKVHVPYSRDEEKWLKTQLQRFNNAQWSVPLNKGLVVEYLMSLVGVPLTGDFFQKLFRSFNQRLSRVLEIHDEYRTLNDRQKKMIISSRCSSATVLILARQDLMISGLKQFKEIFGDVPSIEKIGTLDLSPCKKTHIKKVWMQKSCAALLNSKNVQKLPLGELLRVTNLPGGTTLMREFSEITDDFVHFLLDSIFYQVMILLYLTYPKDDTNWLGNINTMYLKTVWRRLLWATKGQTEKCSMTFAKMFLFFKKIEKWKQDLCSILPDCIIE